MERGLVGMSISRPDSRVPSGDHERREVATVDQWVESALIRCRPRSMTQMRTVHGRSMEALRWIHLAMERDALPSGDQLGLNAWSVARTSLSRTVGLTTTISPASNPIATASSAPSGDHCGGNHWSVWARLPRSGPIRRACSPPARTPADPTSTTYMALVPVRLAAEEGDLLARPARTIGHGAVVPERGASPPALSRRLATTKRSG